MLQLLNNPAFLGAIIFLILGIVDYALIARFIFPKIEAKNRMSHGSSGQIGAIRSVLVISCFIVFPAVGYFLGPRIFPALGL